MSAYFYEALPRPKPSVQPPDRHWRMDELLLTEAEQAAVAMYLRHDCELTDVPQRGRVFLGRHFPESRS